MRIGTRGSELAMAQTRTVVAMLAERCPELDVRVQEVRTVGDRVTDRPLASLGGFGAFTKELDQRIVAGEIDIAVNSLKDMPVDLTPGTVIAAILPRGPVEDVLLSKVPLEELPRGAVVGSSSVRRRSLLARARPDLEIRDLRGNVLTRIRKWKDGEYDAIVLARAGLKRLGIEEPAFTLDPAIFVPAVGQGAIAIVCAEGSEHIAQLRRLDDARTRIEVEAERHIMRRLGGGCSVPIGIWAVLGEETLTVRGSVLSSDRARDVSIVRTMPVGERERELDEMAAAMLPALEVV